MAIYKVFNECFKKENLEQYYKTNVMYKKTGLDRINTLTMNKRLTEECEIINRKVMNNTYKFTSYKELLINKGRGKVPRIISTPTLRDRIVLGNLKDILLDAFEGFIDSEFVKKKLDDTIAVYKSEKYDSYIKIDMQKFYDSLNHEILMKKVRKKARKKEFLTLIETAITTPTINEFENTAMVDKKSEGVPQGLPISNILASIYMMDFDNKHKNALNYKYFRYVDDILIFCSSNDVKKIIREVFDELTDDYELNPHEIERKGKSKSEYGSIHQGFSYLGYSFEPDKITVKRSSKLKLEHSLEALCSEYAHKKFEEQNLKQFIWTLNLKITGAKVDSKKFGWMFYFSQITDESLLYQLDKLVDKYLKRFEIDYLILDGERKRFVRTYNEIRYKRSKSNYIPNFDLYDIEDKKKFLLNIVGVRIDNLDEEEVEDKFKKFVFKATRDLEKDIQELS